MSKPKLRVVQAGSVTFDNSSGNLRLLLTGWLFDIPGYDTYEYTMDEATTAILEWTKTRIDNYLLKNTEPLSNEVLANDMVSQIEMLNLVDRITKK